MATLAPGILLKLIDGIQSGVKPNGEYRSALLQVTDILPVDVDQKELWPNQGFYVKIADSSHSIYASLPVDEEDLIFSNKIQLGQYMYVDKLDPGSPVPIIVGAKPLPGRHPLVSTPEPITRVKSHGEKIGIEKVPSHRRRGSWGQDKDAVDPISSPFVVKPVTLDFDRSTPKKDTVGFNRKGSISASPMIGRSNKELLFRSSVSGMVPKMAELNKSEVQSVARKSCVGPPSASKFQRVKSLLEQEEKVPHTPINCKEKRKSTTPPPRQRRAEVSSFLPEDDFKPSSASRSSRSKSQTHTMPSKIYTNQSTPISVTPPSNTENLPALSGKLYMIGKEVVQQRETTQKVAQQAIRDATALDALVRVLNLFSELSKNAKPDAPAPCFDQFLCFHQEISQAIRHMESVEAAALALLETVQEKDREPASVLHELAQNSIPQPGNHFLNILKSRNAVSKSATDPGSRSANTKKSGGLKSLNECEKTQTSSNFSAYANAIRLGKQMEAEAGSWFMEFVDEALEKGLKKPRGSTPAFSRKSSSSCPQSLILKVINWVEVEQSDASKRPVHPRAAHITRKLRIKAKNP